MTAGTDDAARQDGRDGDPADAPTDDDGELICGRSCRDGTPCHRAVPIPWTACHEHEGQPPLVALEAGVEESE